MTGKDAKKLKRAELLELLIEQTEENQRLTSAIKRLEEQLAQRILLVEEAGSIAEAALGLSKVFEQAQDAADRYLVSVRQKEQDAQKLLGQTEQSCQQQLEKTRTQCQELEQQTRLRCEELERQTRLRCEELLAEAEGTKLPAPEEPEPLPETPPQGRFSRFLNRR